MHGIMRYVSLVVVACLPMGQVEADIYKYIDGAGNVYFTDTPLKGNRYRLEWHRGTDNFIRESQTRFATLKKWHAPKSVQSKTLARRRSTYEPLIAASAHRYRLSPELLHAVIRAESAYNPSAISSAGARGLMQLMPGTAARYGVSDTFDPAQNVRGGAAYLRDLLDMFDQDLRLAVAGYNAGEGAVMKHGRQIPPYAETQAYVRKVLQYYWAEQPARFAMTVR